MEGECAVTYPNQSLMLLLLLLFWRASVALKSLQALFNLTNDPWERVDLSADFPDIVSSLTARLADWGKSAMTPYWATSPIDPKSDPSLRNGTWTPWLT